MQINKLSAIHQTIPSSILASLIMCKRRENYMAYRPDGYYTLHVSEAAALQTAARMNCMRVVNLRE